MKLALAFILAAVASAPGSEPAQQPAPVKEGRKSPAVQVEVNPSEVLLGQPFRLKIKVEAPPGSLRLPGELELEPLAIRSRSHRAVTEGKRSYEVFELELACYSKLGKVEIPGFSLQPAAGAGIQPVEVPPSQVRVKSTIEKADDAKPRDVAGPVSIEIADYRPLAAGGVLLCWLLLGLVLHRRGGMEIRLPPPLEPLPPELAPDELAKRKIEGIVARGLPAKKRYAEFFDAVSDVLREYLGNRYGFFALDLTTGELVRALRDRPTPGLDLGLLRRLLEDADLVKFARHTPDDEMCSRAIDGAIEIIESTTNALPRDEK
ncbi:MAG: hypothetical protein D6806_18020 [Deltaproteobacteria bacterium]|nr:MAG: hypothetical protein D6806_18020 [Deltaproteobacteria bacterium]